MALFFIGVIFVSAPKAKAAPAGDQVVINEICPKPDAGNAWIELYNPTNDNIDLSEYTIEDGTHKPKTLDGYSILAKEYFVIDKSSPNGFGFVLNTASAELVILKKDTLIIDQVSYGKWDDPVYDNNPDDDPPIPGQGKSLSRIPNGSDTNTDNIDFRVLTPTMGTENKLLPYSDPVIINEIVPQPADGSLNEYIELFNSGSGPVNLSSWQIDDISSGGSSPYTIPDGTMIAAGGYLSFYNSIDHISLNDSGDWARLIDPNGDEKSSINYTSSKRGQSYSKFAGSWQWTTTLTPNVENILTVETVVADLDAPILQTDIAGARNQPDGETVQIIGIVSVAPGKLSTQYFYIQDGNSGIQIYNYNKDFPTLTVGDQVQITGEMGSISNERRLKISQLSDIIILSTHPPPEPTKTTISQVGESFEGQYISVIGTVTKTSGSTFYIHGSGEIQISIREGTGIKKPTMHVGDKVQIAGILSQYGDSYRILPIIQSDVRIISSSGLPNSGSSVLYTLIISAIFSWITLAILPKRRRI